MSKQQPLSINMLNMLVVLQLKAAVASECRLDPTDDPLLQYKASPWHSSDGNTLGELRTLRALLRRGLVNQRFITTVYTDRSFNTQMVLSNTVVEAERWRINGQGTWALRTAIREDGYRTMVMAGVYEHDLRLWTDQPISDL